MPTEQAENQYLLILEKEASDQIQRSRIKGYTLATQVFNRRKDFDPTIDTIVRIQAGRLRRTLESYYADSGSQNQLKIEIGKGSYEPAFSWIIPEELRMEKSQQPALMRLPELEISQGTPEASHFPAGKGPAIAVMPLINLTNDPDQERLASGLTEELMSKLGRCHGLQVSVSHFSMQLNGKPIGIQARQKIRWNSFWREAFERQGRLSSSPSG